MKSDPKWATPKRTPCAASTNLTKFSQRPFTQQKHVCGDLGCKKS